MGQRLTNEELAQMSGDPLLDYLTENDGIEWLIKHPGGAVGFHEYKGYCFLHCRIWADWTMENRNKCFELWPQVLDNLRKRGYKKIYAVGPENDRKMALFHRLFGFKTELGRREGLTVKVQEI